MIQVAYVVRRTTVAAVLAVGSVLQSSNVGDTATEQVIFRSLLAVQDRSSSVTVVDATPLSLIRPTASQWIWFGDSAAALRSKVESTVDVTPDIFTLASFPPSTQLVPRAELQPLRRPGHDVLTLWAAFLERFGSREFLAFSRPVVTDDGLDALVYRALACGPECGRTDLFWLHRPARSEAWSVVKELPITIS